jgi:parvulin-like peptidyl-prolyl isomerase
MLKTKQLKFIVIASFLCAVFLNFQKSALAENKIVAVVNNDVITSRDLHDFMNFMYIQLSQKLSQQDLENKTEAMKSDALNKLIEDRLILQEAKKEDISADENRVKARLHELRSRYFSDEEFQKELVRQGLTQADLETKIREQILIYTLVETKIRSKITVTPKEVTAFYEENEQEFLEPESRRVESLVIKDDNLLLDVINSLKEGMGFEEVSKKYSLEINNPGLVKKGQLKKEFEDVIFALSPSVISDPVRSENAYYFFKVDEVIPSKTYTLTEVQDQIYNIIFGEKMTRELTKWLEGLREKSYVEIKTN